MFKNILITNSFTVAMMVLIPLSEFCVDSALDGHALAMTVRCDNHSSSVRRSLEAELELELRNAHLESYFFPRMLVVLSLKHLLLLVLWLPTRGLLNSAISCNWGNFYPIVRNWTTVSYA